MIPLSLILLAVLFVLPSSGKRARLKVASAALIFLVVAAPLTVMVSELGHLGIGETSTINYAFYTKRLPISASWPVCQWNA
jgi:hypothetical protein